MWPVFGFRVGLCNVLSHDTHAEQLNGTDEDNDAGRGCPAGYRVAEAEFANDDKHDKDKINEGHRKTKVRCNA